MPTRSPGGRGLRSRVGRARRGRVRTKGLTVSSKHWLGRQLNDPYVAEAKAKGYRSRAAFKLIELDDKFHFIKPGALVLDLGAAPGGGRRVPPARGGAKGRLLGGDILDIDSLAGVETMKLDLMSGQAPAA